MAHKILLVEDSIDMRETIQAGLERDGYRVITAEDGGNAINQLRNNSVDLILLDIGLPDESGLSLILRIKELTNSPVIIVSGKSDTIDKVVGLEMGADDYVGKPFQLKELSARVKVQLRRNAREILPAIRIATGQAQKMKFKDWILDRGRLQVFDRSGKSAGLTVKEIKLLDIFVQSPNRILSRDQLIHLSRSNGASITDRAIDTQILRIRKKLDDDDGELIKSVRGAGYTFTVHAEACN